uniref:Uncharacterized protein n=1 Tax=Arundo donax TaxID=35708 RepID=A0A0A8ZDK8_ARUDO
MMSRRHRARGGRCRRCAQGRRCAPRRAVAAALEEDAADAVLKDAADAVLEDAADAAL